MKDKRERERAKLRWHSQKNTNTPFLETSYTDIIKFEIYTQIHKIHRCIDTQIHKNIHIQTYRHIDTKCQCSVCMFVHHIFSAPTNSEVELLEEIWKIYCGKGIQKEKFRKGIQESDFFFSFLFLLFLYFSLLSKSQRLIINSQNLPGLLISNLPIFPFNNPFP